MKRLIVILLFITSTVTAQHSHIERWKNDSLPEFREMLLEELNFARQEPQTYSKSIGIDLSGFAPAKALVVSDTLMHYAQWYAEWLMANPDKFAHSNFPYAESILWNYDVCESIDQFIIDKNVPDLGHRKHLLSQNEGKVGIGISKGWVGYWYRTYVVILTE